MSETDELAKKLAHRNKLNEGEGEPQFVNTPKNIYTEFPEFTRKQIKDYETIFKKYDAHSTSYLDQSDLQNMMEKLEAPQTYIGLKSMIKEVDEDGDGQISFREFLLIFRKAACGELESVGLCALAQLSEIDVDETGVGGAKDFFEAKMKEVSSSSKFEDEIRMEQEQRKEEEEKKKKSREDFKRKAEAFKGN